MAEQRSSSSVADFGKTHWLMMIGMSLLAIALMFAAGFTLEWLAGKLT